MERIEGSIVECNMIARDRGQRPYCDDGVAMGRSGKKQEVENVELMCLEGGRGETRNALED